MNLTFYKFGILFLGLSIVCGLFQSSIHFQLGGSMHYLQPFADWYLVVNIIMLIGTLFLLKYFQYKKYRVAFFAGLIATLMAFCLFIFNYIVMIFVARDLESYGILLQVLSLSAGIVFALSFIFSQAGKRPWLRTAGVLMFLTYFVFGAAFIWGVMSRDVFMNGTFDKILQWVLLANNLVPVFFIINYGREVSLLKAEEAEGHATREEFSTNLIGLTGLIALAAMFYFGSKVYQESYWALDWKKRGPEHAQKLAQPFEARTYVGSKGDTLKYLLLKPLDYDPQKKYPLVVCLHGGPIPINADKARHAEVPEPAPLLSNQENREKYPAFLFVPQGPPGFSWGGIPNFPAVDSLVFETILALELAFAIDDKRRYVAGGSGGGYGSWHFIGTRPEMFAAAIPFCGAGNTALAPNMVDVPVWAFHGSKDRNVSVSGSRDMIEAIKKAGGNPRYTEFPDTGHNVWPQINKTPGLLDWLFAQKRD
jgi:pimeloyl-ACP methyl ester carboxylesterase